MTRHRAIEEMIAAYALDALSADEMHDAGRELLDHLAWCAECQRVYRDLRETSADLALAAEPAAVSSDFRARVLSVTQQERKPSLRGTTRAAQRVLVASLAAVMALGGLSVYLTTQLNEARSDRAQARQVLAFINQPSTRVTTLQGSGGAGRMTLAVHSDGRALLLGSELRLPPDRLFEIWLVRGAKVVPAGVFVDDAGSAVVEMTVDPARDLGIAITIEAERVQQPTGTPVFQGSIPA